MKKILAYSLLFAFAFCLLFSVGCKKQDYKLVWSVSYTLDGKTYTEKSTYSIAIKGASTGIDCTEADYLSSEHRFENGPFKHTGYELPKDSTTVQAHGTLTEEDIGEYFYVKTSYYNPPVSQVWYKQYEFAGFGYHYVYVKIVDDDTIVLKADGAKTTYNVSSYSLIYFKD
ncbi:MAG: hypothetical protein IJZ32_04700 [Clostridia bacterium]|nr:hypothetical protein [Clostridia bacterium]